MRIQAPQRSSAFVDSAECRFLSQVTFESPQFTNLDNSIDIADRIGELYVVDSYMICICRFWILLRQMRNKILPKLSQKLIPVRFT